MLPSIGLEADGVTVKDITLTPESRLIFGLQRMPQAVPISNGVDHDVAHTKVQAFKILPEAFVAFEMLNDVPMHRATQQKTPHLRAGLVWAILDSNQ